MKSLADKKGSHHAILKTGEDNMRIADEAFRRRNVFVGKPSDTPKRGDSVIFMPPIGAYSRESKQAQCVGRKGTIISAVRPGYSYVTARFNCGDCLVPIYYCERTA